MRYAVGLEAHHGQNWATAQHARQLGEVVVRTKDHPQLVQAGQVIGQAAELVARQIQNLQRVGQRVNLAWKFAQVFTQLQARDAREFSCAQLSQRVHAQRGKVVMAKPIKALTPMTCITLRLYLNKATAAPKASTAERHSKGAFSASCQVWPKPSGHSKW